MNHHYDDVTCFKNKTGTQHVNFYRLYEWMPPQKKESIILSQLKEPTEETVLSGRNAISLPAFEWVSVDAFAACDEVCMLTIKDESLYKKNEPSMLLDSAFEDSFKAMSGQKVGSAQPEVLFSEHKVTPQSAHVTDPAVSPSRTQLTSENYSHLFAEKKDEHAHTFNVAKNQSLKLLFRRISSCH